MLCNDWGLSLPTLLIHLDPSLIETDEETRGKKKGAGTSFVNKTDSEGTPLEALLHKLWKRVEPEDYSTIPGIYSSV